jgi:hypothetical protein
MAPVLVTVAMRAMMRMMRRPVVGAMLRATMLLVLLVFLVLLIRYEVGANRSQQRTSYRAQRSASKLVADECAPRAAQEGRTKSTVAFSWTAGRTGLAICWRTIALLWVMIALLLMRSILLVGIMIALLLVWLRWVGRSAAVWVVALLVVLLLRRGTIAVLGRLRVGIVRWWRVLALALGVRAMVSLTVLVVRLLSIRLALRRVALILLSIAMLLLLLVCVVVAVAVALTVALALTVVILTRHVGLESAFQKSQ